MGVNAVYGTCLSRSAAVPRPASARGHCFAPGPVWTVLNPNPLTEVEDPYRLSFGFLQWGPIYGHLTSLGSLVYGAVSDGGWCS